MGKEINKVLNSIYSFDEKVGLQNLESHSVELGIIQDTIKIVNNANKNFSDAFLLVSTARQKAVPIMKNSITEAENFLNKLVEIKKTTKEFGLDLPQEFLKAEQKAGELIGEAKDIIDWLNKY